MLNAQADGKPRDRGPRGLATERPAAAAPLAAFLSTAMRSRNFCCVMTPA